MHAAVLVALLFIAPGQAAPLVEQDVDLVSIAHLPDDVRLVFFWQRVQGQWTCIDYRWHSPQMSLSNDCDGFTLAWPDDNQNCYRVIRAPAYVESWEPQNPLAEQNQWPWFRQLLNPGLRQPPKAD